MNNFDKNWRNAKKNIFRLEGRIEYRLSGEQEDIAKWKQNDIDSGKNKEWRGWQASLKKALQKGIVVQRVRVAPKTLPDYIKFEISRWQKNPDKNGEQVLFLNENDYREIIAAYGFDPKDFWLFDDQNLLIFNYDKVGRFSGDISITNGGMVKRYCELKSKLLEKSIPMEQFLKKI
ncbi:MAG: DUF6879 family protein [Minisyncoccales bacterium]